MPYTPSSGARPTRADRPSFGGRSSSAGRRSYGDRPFGDRPYESRKRGGPDRGPKAKTPELEVIDPARHSPAFAALGVSSPLLDALVTAGIANPFPVQSATLPDALAGLDVCGRAPTGSGKTLAYGLAILGRIERANPGAPKALILVPTRELAKQVAEVLVPYSRRTTRWVTAFFGGAGMGRQIADLQRGVDVAVATPGRLLDLINRGECRLDEVSMVIIDEADRMADMGFTPQVKKLLDEITGERQILLYSATLDGDVDNLIKTYMNSPVMHDIGGEEGLDELEATKRAQHVVVQTKFESKYQDLAQVLGATKRGIVFVKNRFATERGAAAVESLGVSALPMHGGMTQNARETSLKRWAQGEVVALFATDVAARGVHVAGVEAVIHLDPPQDEKDYIHRSGRTARAGAHGLVVNLFRKEQLRPGAAMHRRMGVDVVSVTMDEALAMIGEVQAKNREVAENPVANAPVATETWTTSIVSEDDITEVDEWVESPGRENREGNGRFEARTSGFGGGSRDGGSSGSRPFPARGDRPFAPRDRGAERDRPDRGDRPFAPRGDRPFESRGDRPFAARGDRPFTPRGDRPSFGDRPDRSDRSDRPFASRGDRPSAPRGDRPFESRGDRPDRGDRSFAPRGDRPSFGDRPDRGGDRPFNRDRQGGFGGDRDRRPGGFGGDRPARPFDRDRNERSVLGAKPWGAPRPFDRDRPSGDFDRDRSPRGDRSFGDRPGGGGRPTGYFGANRGGPSDRDGGSSRPWTPKGPRSEGTFGAERDARSDRPWTERRPGGDRPGGDRGGFAGRSDRPFNDKRSFGDRPGGFAGRSDRPGGFAGRSDRPGSFAGRSERPTGDRPAFDRNAVRDGGRSWSSTRVGGDGAPAGANSASRNEPWKSEGAGGTDRPKRVRPPRS